jgi:3-methyl-2-oxobutanoate hydroxymethyltransferase
MARLRIANFQQMKEQGQRIPCLTAYDYPTARIANEAGIPLLLVGDSLGTVVLGYDSTVPVTMEEMLHHVKPVVRGSERALVVADLPFMSYQVSAAEALRNAGRMLQEGGAQAVKLEGGQRMADTVHLMVEAGIPVMGHIGLTPQSLNQLGSDQVSSSSLAEALELLQDALALEKAGVFSLVLQAVPSQLAKVITARLTIPTIGIGSGRECDGQIVVTQDILGLGTSLERRNVKLYAHLAEVVSQALRAYAGEVGSRVYPGDELTHSLPDGVMEQLIASMDTSVE